MRLIGIDTPETRRPGTPIECGGPKASELMHRMADGRGITLLTDPSQDRFVRYGRLLAYAVRRDGLDLGGVGRVGTGVRRQRRSLGGRAGKCPWTPRTCTWMT